APGGSQLDLPGVLERRDHHQVQGQQVEQRRDHQRRVDQHTTKPTPGGGAGRDPTSCVPVCIEQEAHTRTSLRRLERRYGMMTAATITSRTIAMAAPLANWLARKLRRYMSSAGTSVVALSAPAMAQMRSKILRLMCPRMIMADRVMGANRGRITCRYSCHSLAPSARAASRRSSDTPRSPARYRAMV